MIFKLRKQAVKEGVRTVNKTQIVELLTNGGRVVGAAGFDIVDGTFRLFTARSVILATGSCNWMVTNMWTSGRGDGIAAAYRAGAEMRNAEFSNFYNMHLRGNLSAIVGGQYALYNNEGDYLADKYCGDFECDIDIGILIGMEKEVIEGKGPIRFEPSQYFLKNPLAAKGFLFKWDRPVAKRFWETLFAKEGRYNVDHAARPEVIPGFIGECSCVKVDHTIKTTLDGLWAVGDTSHAGSAWAGAVPAPPGRIRGAALMYTAVSALLAATPAAEYAAGSSDPGMDQEQIRSYERDIYAPMERKDGVSPRPIISDLKEVVAPPRYSIWKSKERLEEAIARVKKIWDQAAEVSAAEDWHVLGLCHDLRNMIQCADVYFSAALARTETRGWHYREDFPKRDDENWLKWIIVKRKDGGIHVSTKDIPIERYKSKPGLSPIEAV